MSATPIEIQPTDESPMITFNPSDQKIIIEGVSMPENAYEFYHPVFESILSQIHPDKSIYLSVNLVYMNSMSNKQIVRFIKNLSDNNELTLLWNYKKGDDLIRIKGEELKIIFPDVAITLTENN